MIRLVFKSLAHQFLWASLVLVTPAAADAGPVRHWVHDHRPGIVVPKKSLYDAPQFVVPQQMPARPFLFAPGQACPCGPACPCPPGVCPGGVCPAPPAPKAQLKVKLLD